MLFLRSLMVLVLAATPGWSRDSESLATTRPCPVQFGEFPEKVGGHELDEVKLLGRNMDSIEILSPHERGMFVLRVDRMDRNAIYGTYRTVTVEATRAYPLAHGLRGLDWRTVAESHSGPAAEVPTGSYRVVVRYTSYLPGDSGGSLVCLALSPVFELTEPFMLIGSR